MTIFRTGSINRFGTKSSYFRTASHTTNFSFRTEFANLFKQDFWYLSWMVTMSLHFKMPKSPREIIGRKFTLTTIFNFSKGMCWIKRNEDQKYLGPLCDCLNSLFFPQPLNFKPYSINLLQIKDLLTLNDL